MPQDAEPWSGLAAAVGDDEVLIVLDGWELLMAATPELATLLRSAPGAHVLITSRERLQLPEEHVLGLRGLVVPDAAAGTSPKDSAAVRMLLSEARRHAITWPRGCGSQSPPATRCAPTGSERSWCTR